MLRPATPLTVLLCTSFVLLLLSVLTTPVIKGIPIAQFQDVNFGVFGFCTPEECSGISVGYTTDDVFDDRENDADFSLPASARHSLSALLVVHPIAAFFNLVCLGLAGAAHLHSPSHSARYLLGLLIFLLPTLLVTLLAFLVDVLLFVPHLQWGGWIVLASTILITASGVVTCAMRRTLVSRKARKKRIAENAEMSGENFYNRQNSFPKTEQPSSSHSVQPTMPMVYGAPGSDSVPILSTFNKETETFAAGRDVDRKTPPSRTDGGPMGYRGRYGDSHGSFRSRSQDQPRNLRDGYGVPFSPDGPGAAPSSVHRGPSDPNLRHTASRERMNGPPTGVRGGPIHRGPIGRGGYPSRGNFGPPRNGFGGPRGGMNGGYGRGGYPDRRGNYGGRGRGGMMSPGIDNGIAAGSQMGRSAQAMQPASSLRYHPPGRQASHERLGLDGLHRNPSMGEIRSPSAGNSTRQPAPAMAPPLPQSAPLVGQAIELRAAAESPGSAYSSEQAPRPPYSAPGRVLSTHSSIYSQAPDAYVPPRAEWNTSNTNASPNFSRPAVNNTTDPPVNSSSSTPGTRPRAASSVYYEDIDPRFTESHAQPQPPPPPPPPPPFEPAMLPRSLTPGSHPSRQGRPFPPTSFDERLPQRDADGTRSPTGSDISHFTSVSQREVNPSWRPGNEDVRNMPPQEERAGNPSPGMPSARGVRERDVLLETNPDFAVPGAGPPGRNGTIRGNRPGGATPGPTRMGPAATPMPANGLTGVGRYPPA